jgi:hypothetical protein
MPDDGPNEEFSLSLPPESARVLRYMASARYHGDVSVAVAAAIEGWVSSLRDRDGALADMAEYEAEHGAFTQQELATARSAAAEKMRDSDR